MKPLAAIFLKISVVILIVVASFVALRVMRQVGVESPMQARPTDQDQDGLADSVEKRYGTNPTLFDTDGDGTGDGDEVSAGRNPLLAGDDILRPLAGSNARLGDTYTQRYLAQLPEDTPQSEILNEEQIELFITQMRGQLIPETPNIQLQVVPISEEALSRYFESISSQSNDAVISVTAQDIEAAYRLDYVNHEPETMEKIIVALEQNLEVYRNVAVPEDLLDSHNRLILLNQVLLDNVRLLHDMKRDFVGGLIAAKNISDLAPHFRELGEDIEQARAQYGISTAATSGEV